MPILLALLGHITNNIHSKESADEQILAKFKLSKCSCGRSHGFFYSNGHMSMARLAAGIGFGVINLLNAVC